ncbi:MAG TPA: phosphoribosylamine--glycine ligase, partial [Anaerolineales bacterium]|nr:phosphoribosylamine--glycine ligase [Anaerolineales bacterium]
MKILIVGSGGREHALAWACSRSGLKPDIFCALGNGGTTRIARNIDIGAENLDNLVGFVKREKIDLTVIGPEAPLVDGLADKLIKDGYLVFGPTSGAARIEGSKSFAKQLMSETGIPTAGYAIFTEFDKARKYIQENPKALVVKAAGLAAGKGVTVCLDSQEAILVAEAMLLKCKFGQASREIVVEDCICGKEMSLMALVDDEDFLLLPPSRDHKRALDNDQGPNTGGMGAYSPLDELEPGEISDMAKLIFPPVLKRLAESGTPFRGLLYAGLMLTPEGVKVLEFNCRFGDPEVQAVIPTVSEDPLEMMLAVAEGRLVRWELDHRVTSVDWRKLSNKKHAVSVVVAAEGYPSDYQKGMRIEHLPDETGDVITFHADTTIKGGKLVTSGGRVLAVTGIGSTH